VLDAALEQFVEHGYRGTSMEAIAEAAGVSKPVVYECYPSKEKLFRALLEREEQRLGEAVAAALPKSPSFEDVEAVLAEGLIALEQAGTEDVERKAPVLAELLAATGRTSVKVLLESGGHWTPEELGGFVARVQARGAGAA
jgi:AcrR family transcriptional regulator